MCDLYHIHVRQKNKWKKRTFRSLCRMRTRQPKSPTHRSLGEKNMKEVETSENFRKE